MGSIFEWYQSNQRTSYPFRDRQQGNIHELFVDAVVYHNLHRDKAGDIRINYYRLEPAASVELRFSDGTVLAYLTDGAPGVNYQTSTFGAYTLYEWSRSTVNGSGFTDEDVVIRLVVLTARLADLPTEYYPADGTLVASLINPAAKRVRRLFVKRALTGEIDLVTHPKVHFEGGNNLEFVKSIPIAGTEVTRQPTTVVVNAAAGLGVGPELRCDELEGIKRINLVEPDERGDFKLEGSPCSWFERPMRNPRSPIHPNTDTLLDPANAQWPYNAPVKIGPGLIMHQDCQACCSCDDYVNAYRTMLEWWQRAQDVSRRIQNLQIEYNDLCSKINSGRGKIPRGVQCILFLLPRPDFFLAVSCLLYNNTDSTLPPTQVVIKVDQPRSRISYSRKSGYLNFSGTEYVQIDPFITPEGMWSSSSSSEGADPDAGSLATLFIIEFKELEKGKYARFSMNLRFNAFMSTRGQQSVTVTAKAFDRDNETERAGDVKTAQLSGPLVKT